MRLMVLFDLPVTSKEERSIANKFRHFLKSDGYDPRFRSSLRKPMIQQG